MHSRHGVIIRVTRTVTASVVWKYWTSLFYYRRHIYNLKAEYIYKTCGTCTFNLSAHFI